MRKYGLSLVLTAGLFAQESPGDKVSVAFSNPSKPGQVKVHVINGNITVTGYDGKEVVVEARGRSMRASKPPAGMKRIEVGGSGLTVEEQDNVMTVSAASMSRSADIVLQVPFKTSLKLSAVNGGGIKVERVEGEIDANNINGGVTLTNVSGAVVAHALNGKVMATFTKVDGQKPMSFSSLNGAIDVTFPPDVKANVRMKTEHGEMYTDFDMAIAPTAGKPAMENRRDPKGKYKVRVDRTITGTINGGGPEIQFKNFNGPIYIRKGK